MENPEKIEIEGLKTIHKLCKFGVEHNMEGCSFTEIVERMFVELAKAKSDAVPEGFVLVPKEQFESLNEFKDLYKRAIINAKKHKDQINWAHVANLGVGSGRAVQLCKELGIDPSATNMHAVEAQEQNG